MPYPCVSIHIVTWNSMRFLPDLLESIMEQTYSDFNVLVIDNGSTDGIEAFVRERYPQIVFLRNARNLGFSPAHNQGIRYAIEHWPADALRDRFILLANPDTIFTPSFLEMLMAQTRAHPEVGSFGGKLLRAFGEHLDDDVFHEVVRSDRIDSVGLNPHRHGTVTDRGAGELDEGQYDKQEAVFGISGALALYRAAALEDVRFRDEFLDQDFFAYKEDVDLAWRLQRAGWDALYVPEAVAYHYRGMYGPERSGLWQRLRHRQEKSSLRNYLSTRNHWLILFKNLSLKDLFFRLPWLLAYEAGRLGYTLIFENTGRRAFVEAMALLPSMWKKRRAIFAKTRRPAKQVRAWFW